VYDWCVACGILITVMSVPLALRHIVGRVAARGTTAPVPGIAANLLATVRLWMLLPFAIFVAASALDLPQRIDRLVNVIAVGALLFQAAICINVLVGRWIAHQIDRRGSVDGDAVTVLNLLGFSIRVIVWTLVLLSILKHLHFDVDALITGLGIGGVAVALAVQNVLGDLFASLSIVLDKPFVVGDFIVVGDCLGTVEHIGLKTTRVRSLSGELIVFANAELLKSRIHNYRHLYRRRVVFTFGVTYQTSAEKLENIPVIVREAVESQRQTHFDRAHFKEYGPFSLVFETVYFVVSAEFNIYMDIQQAINLFILRRFVKEGIEFAYPTTTVQVNNVRASRRGELSVVTGDAHYGAAT
jgi:small-conductance mechanosensitive channel